MRVQLRIVAGSLRGRRLTCDVNPELRPTPQMVREALFSILGNAVPERPFIDIFAGTGIIGLEALSRGAEHVTFLERDFRLAQAIDERMNSFHVADQGQVLRTDAYRWVSLWHAPAEPVNVFLSPPFIDLQRRSQDFIAMVEQLQRKVAVGSVIVVQSEKDVLVDELPQLDQWDQRMYGRNVLLFWVKEQEAGPGSAAPASAE
jgi:16S rRNA (guanine(966)-N(2))-methyltransferase RsmD